MMTRAITSLLPHGAFVTLYANQVLIMTIFSNKKTRKRGP
jgi:hypothetical protein